MPHGYTDDIPHGYRKSFSLMGKVKSCLLKSLVIAFSKLNKRRGAETNFLSYTVLQYLDFLLANCALFGT